MGMRNIEINAGVSIATTIASALGTFESWIEVERVMRVPDEAIARQRASLFEQSVTELLTSKGLAPELAAASAARMVARLLDAWRLVHADAAGRS